MTQTELSTFSNAAKLCRAGKNKLRAKIVETLRTFGPLTVIELHIKCKTDQPTMSQQLRILKDAGFVSGVRNGKSITYHVNELRIKQVIGIFEQLNEI